MFFSIFFNFSRSNRPDPPGEPGPARKTGRVPGVRIVKADFAVLKPTLRLVIKVSKHFSQLKGSFLRPPM